VLNRKGKLVIKTNLVGLAAAVSGECCALRAVIRASIHCRGARCRGRRRLTVLKVSAEAHPVVIIRTSEHHVLSRPRLSVRMFGSSGKKRANASSNCATL
jgi:hypothetical protein